MNPTVAINPTTKQAVTRAAAQVGTYGLWFVADKILDMLAERIAIRLIQTEDQEHRSIKFFEGSEVESKSCSAIQ